MKLFYVTDQVLPQTATDTEQLVSMSSAFGQAGMEVEIVNLLRSQKSSPQEVAEYYGVEPAFTLHPIKTGSTLIRGQEKFRQAKRAAQYLAGQDGFLYSRNLPAVWYGLRFTKLPVFWETYRPWPEQSSWAQPFWNWLSQQSQLKGLILHSQYAADAYREAGFSKEQLLVAHNGYAPERFQPVLSKSEARSKLGLEKDATIVSYAGRVTMEKGLGILLELAKAFPNTTFMIIGSEGEGEVEQRAAKLSNVSVIDWQPVSDTTPYLYASDILFIPPTTKPLEEVGNTVLPMKTFMYMATGRAILAPDSADVKEVLSHQENAYLVEPDNLNAIKKGLETLVKQPELRCRLGETARRDIEAHTWQRRAEKVRDFMASKCSEAKRESIS
jgi:starch synthase